MELVIFPGKKAIYGQLFTTVKSPSTLSGRGAKTLFVGDNHGRNRACPSILVWIQFRQVDSGAKQEYLDNPLFGLVLSAIISVPTALTAPENQFNHWIGDSIFKDNCGSYPIPSTFLVPSRTT